MWTCQKSGLSASRTAVFLLALLVLLVGCVRYARTLNVLYEPVTDVRGGSGDLYVVIPAEQHTPANKLKWVMGEVKDDWGNKIDEVYSPFSPGELLQNALAQELKRAGYRVIPVAAPPAHPGKALNLVRSEVAVDQETGKAGVSAKARLLMTLEVSRDGQVLKKMTYEGSHSASSIKDRDLLAREVLEGTLQAVMRKAVPELVPLLEETGR